MNCKPNQLVRVISSRNTDELGLTDKILTTGNFMRMPNGEIGFYIYPKQNTINGEVDGLGDSLLRPIENPGDDVEDESKAWLPPVPKLEKV